MRVGDLVGYIDGVGPTGLVLGIWSEWADDGWDEEQAVQTWIEVLWSSGMIDEHLSETLEKVNESR